MAVPKTQPDSTLTRLEPRQGLAKRLKPGPNIKF